MSNETDPSLKPPPPSEDANGAIVEGGAVDAASGAPTRGTQKTKDEKTSLEAWYEKLMPTEEYQLKFDAVSKGLTYWTSRTSNQGQVVRRYFSEDKKLYVIGEFEGSPILVDVTRGKYRFVAQPDTLRRLLDHFYVKYFCDPTRRRHTKLDFQTRILKNNIEMGPIISFLNTTTYWDEEVPKERAKRELDNGQRDAANGTSRSAVGPALTQPVLVQLHIGQLTIVDRPFVDESNHNQRTNNNDHDVRDAELPDPIRNALEEYATKVVFQEAAVAESRGETHGVHEWLNRFLGDQFTEGEMFALEVAADEGVLPFKHEGSVQPCYMCASIIKETFERGDSMSRAFRCPEHKGKDTP